MAFKKAVQLVKTEAYLKYVEALAIYKQECTAHKRALKAYKGSVIPMERLKYFEAKERFSLACKAYYVARDEYARERVIKVMEERGVKDLSGLTLARLAAINIPMSMNEMIKAAQQENAIAKVEADPVAKKLYEEMLKKQQSTPSVKEQFLESTSESMTNSIEFDPEFDKL